MPRIAVVIVGWNSWDVLPRCLNCLAAQTYTDFSVTVIDNASTAPIPAELQAAHPQVNVVRNVSNLGFAAANNLAVNQHTGNSEWVALLNPDAFPEPQWLAELMLASASNPQCSVFASRQLQADDPSILDGEGDAYHISGRAWRAGYGRPAAQTANAIQPVFGPCAAAGLYRRSVFTALGGFDEDFFCYFEDVDLSFRLQLAGHGCLLVPRAVVHHQGASSTGHAHSDFAVYYGHRNLVWAYVKNMPGALLWLTLPLHIALNLATLLLYALRPRVIWRAKRDAVMGLAGVWRKRRAIQANRKVSLLTILRRLSWRLFPF